MNGRRSMRSRDGCGSVLAGAWALWALASCATQGGPRLLAEAPATLAIAPPIWALRPESAAALVSTVDDQFVASLSRALVGAGFRLVDASGTGPAEGTSGGRVSTTLSAVESGGGVRAAIDLTATIRLGGPDQAEGRDDAIVVHASAVGELGDGLDALEDMSSILARLRVATARAAAARLGEESARLWSPPVDTAPSLVRKHEPISNAWAVPVAGRLPLCTWDEIEVGLDAGAGLDGAVRIGGTPSVVPLVETRRGHYATRFRVPPGLAPGALALTARLSDPSGRHDEVELAPGALLADSDRPLPPAGLTVRRTGGKTAGGFALTWAWRPENGVVHHYGVFRSDGFPYRFTFVGRTHETGFGDPFTVDEHGFFDLTRRYYTVLGYDAAGNPSPPSELVSIAPDASAPTGTALFGPGRLRAEEAAAKRERPSVAARYRITTSTSSPLRTTLAGRELEDPRATITLATGRATRGSDGAAELDVLVLGSESAVATVTVGASTSAWPLAEIEPGTYAGAVPLDLVGGEAGPSEGRIRARARLTDTAGFEALARFSVPARVAEPGSSAASTTTDGTLEDHGERDD
ncbi:MAG: hypothetical protein U0610_31340 [bacterium]